MRASLTTRLILRRCRYSRPAADFSPMLKCFLTCNGMNVTSLQSYICHFPQPPYSSFLQLIDTHCVTAMRNISVPIRRLINYLVTNHFRGQRAMRQRQSPDSRGRARATSACRRRPRVTFTFSFWGCRPCRRPLPRSQAAAAPHSPPAPGRCRCRPPPLAWPSSCPCFSSCWAPHPHRQRWPPRPRRAPPPPLTARPCLAMDVRQLGALGCVAARLVASQRSGQTGGKKRRRANKQRW